MPYPYLHWLIEIQHDLQPMPFTNGKVFDLKPLKRTREERVLIRAARRSGAKQRRNAEINRRYREIIRAKRGMQ